MSCSVLQRTSSNTNIDSLHWFPKSNDFDRTQLIPVKMFHLTVDERGWDSWVDIKGGVPPWERSLFRRDRQWDEGEPREGNGKEGGRDLLAVGPYNPKAMDSRVKEGEGFPLLPPRAHITNLGPLPYII